MIKLVTHSSLLKDDDVRLKGTPVFSRFCDQCDHGSVDNVRHLILQCPSLQESRGNMMGELADVNGGEGRTIMDEANDLLDLLLGKMDNDEPINAQLKEFWSIAARNIARMYWTKTRAGIG